MSYAQVALPLPLRRTFTYRVPESLAGRVSPGVEVRVPFRRRPQRGFVLSLDDATDLARVEEIAGVDGGPLFSPHLLELCRWIAEYYLAPIGEVLAAALPGGLEGFARSRARKGATEDAIVRMALPERLRLTPAQRRALEVAGASLLRGTFAPLLLHGVTASGKTEIYLRAASAAREAGGSAAGSACCTPTSRSASAAATGSWPRAARSTWWWGRAPRCSRRCPRCG